MEADLSGANLSDANLVGAYLREAKLHRADLRRAKLNSTDLNRAQFQGSDLSGADLSDANLIEANLSNSNLSGANFCEADLLGANLRRANLRETNFRGADLRGVDFAEATLAETELTWARIGETTFASIDLSTAKGLDTVIHYAPSTIGIDTLLMSNGKIPDRFLREAGLPEDVIIFVPSLVGAAIEFYSCFISYSHDDEGFARRLHSRMRTENLRVWFAPEDMKAGRKLHEEIFRAIQIHDKLLLVLSEHSMKSEWVTTEIRRAKRVEREEDRRKLFPIRLVDFETIQKWECFDADSGKDLAAEVREYYIPDFSNWKDHDLFESEFAKLLRDLRATEK